MAEISISVYGGHPCDVKGCKDAGRPCWLPLDNPTEEPPPDKWLCGKHAHREGFCWGCGLFWGGVESFDFGSGARTGLCENCLGSGEYEDEDDDGDEYENSSGEYEDEDEDEDEESP